MYYYLLFLTIPLDLHCVYCFVNQSDNLVYIMLNNAKPPLAGWKKMRNTIHNDFNFNNGGTYYTYFYFLLITALTGLLSAKAKINNSKFNKNINRNIDDKSIITENLNLDPSSVGKNKNLHDHDSKFPKYPLERLLIDNIVYHPGENERTAEADKINKNRAVDTVKLNNMKTNQRRPDYYETDLLHNNQPHLTENGLLKNIYSQSTPYQKKFDRILKSQWEERFEGNDFGRQRYQGEVKWADNNGRHGEHLWDLAYIGK